MAVEKPQYPGDMDIYDLFQWPESVPFKPFSELTPEQRDLVLGKYRFSGFRPGMYQGPTFVSKNGILPL